MGATGLLLSPVLLGRDDLRALAGRRLDSAAAGQGQLLFLAGEAGIGKTRLLDSILLRAQDSAFVVVRGAAFAGDLELAGGVLLDVARDLGRSGEPRLQDIGTAMSARVLEAPPPEGDMHRQRRLLILDLADLLLSLVGDHPIVLALEDLHWADDLTLEVLGQLARRLRQSRMLVVGTYRSDELYPRVPMREWRSHLLAQRLGEEAKLNRLTLAETATMTSAVLGTGAAIPTQLIDTLYERSDGIPLHVEELLAVIRGGESGDDLRSAPVPDTLAGAVVTRAATLSEQSRRVAEAAAVIGRSFDFDLLTTLVDAADDEVAGSLRELQDRHFVRPSPAGARFDFRHALIRDALYAEIPISAVRRLHERVAEEAIRRGFADSFISAHFEAGGRCADAYGYAVRAARQAAAMSSHREALDLFNRAWRNLPADSSSVEQATLLVEIAAESTATDHNEWAAEAYERAHQLFVDAGRLLEAAEVVPELVAVRHLLGDALAERVRRLDDGLQLLERASASGGVDPDRLVSARAALLAALSAAYMLDRRLDESISFGEQAQELMSSGDQAAQLNTGATLGSVLVFAGRLEEGWNLLEESVRRARSSRLESEAARAYRMIGSSASVLVDYDRAERWLREGIDYAERVEMWNHRHYMAAHLAHVKWALGEWSAAEEIAKQALADGRGGVTTRITALHALGYVALGHGDWDFAVRLLDEARELGERMAELQRLSPALWGLAETALHTGSFEESLAWCERAYGESNRVGDAAYAFPFMITGTRALLATADVRAAQEWVDRVGALLVFRRIPNTLPAIDHAQGLIHFAAGRTKQAREALERAHTEWDRLRRSWEGGHVLCDLSRCAARSNQPAAAAGWAEQARARGLALGSPPLIQQTEECLATLRGKDAAEQSAWAPLTPREFEVARLVADGLTNRQIAAELVVSPKTVSAHIEHMLTKLNASRRSEIATWVTSTQASLHHQPQSEQP